MRKIGAHLHTAIPKGLNNSAQGCEERATLGALRRESTTLKGLQPFPSSAASQARRSAAFMPLQRTKVGTVRLKPKSLENCTAKRHKCRAPSRLCQSSCLHRAATLSGLYSSCLFSKGSSFLATLGFVTESLRDSSTRQFSLPSVTKRKKAL